MRKRSSGGSDDLGDINVTPLMDIVFIMLIFFIVTATFTKEKGIDVQTPDDTPPPKDSIPPPALLLALQEDGFVRVNNVRIIDPGSTKPTVEEFMAREPKGVVIVTAAGAADSGTAVEVMDQAWAGNATAVSLALQTDDE